MMLFFVGSGVSKSFMVLKSPRNIYVSIFVHCTMSMKERKHLKEKSRCTTLFLSSVVNKSDEFTSGEALQTINMNQVTSFQYWIKEVHCPSGSDAACIYIKLLACETLSQWSM